MNKPDRRRFALLLAGELQANHVAKRLKIHYPTFCDIVRGVRIPTANEVAALAREFDETPEAIAKALAKVQRERQRGMVA